MATTKRTTRTELNGEDFNQLVEELERDVPKYVEPDGRVYAGYEAESLDNWMVEKGWAEGIYGFRKFITGQTGVILQGRYIIYDHDVERFLWRKKRWLNRISTEVTDQVTSKASLNGLSKTDQLLEIDRRIKERSRE